MWHKTAELVWHKTAELVWQFMASYSSMLEPVHQGLLKEFFNQHSALQDYVEVSVMLEYNNINDHTYSCQKMMLDYAHYRNTAIMLKIMPA